MKVRSTVYGREAPDVEGGVTSTANYLVEGAPQDMLFKFGVAHDLSHRWGNSDFGYEKLGSYKMITLAHVSAGTARRLERVLIDQFRRHPRIRNVAPGGEGIPSSPYSASPEYFVYVVFGGRLGDPWLTTYGPIRHSSR